jgi:DNA repair photolyase
MRRIFEPEAPPVAARIEALKKLHKTGISTYVFIGPLLPMNPESLAGQIGPFVNRILIDRMNYTGKTGWLFRKYRIEQWLNEEFAGAEINRLKKVFSGKNIELC